MNQITSQYVVYADILFATNFAMDLTILWATAKILNLPKSKWRLLLSATIGGAYGTAMILPKTAIFYTLPVALLMPTIMLIIMLIIAFSWSNLKNLLVQNLAFYILSFAMSGGIYGLSNLLNSSQTSALWLIFGTFIAYILGNAGMQTLKAFFAETDQKVTVEIHYENQFATVNCLLDTGNQLKDPLTKSDVLVVELAGILNILPELLQQQLKLAQENKLAIYEVFANCQNQAWSQNLSLIPYSAIGTQGDFLLALRPDKVIIKGENLKTFEAKHLLTALYTGKIPTKTNCSGILNPKVIYEKI